MKLLFICVILVIASTSSDLDTPLATFHIPIQVDDCALGRSLADLSLLAHFAYVVERAPGSCDRRDNIGTVIEAVAQTARQLLDALMALNPQYEWREIGDVIVVRPKDEWTRKSHFLNRSVSPFEATTEHLGRAFEMISQPFTPRGFRDRDRWLVDSRRDLPTATIRFSGGTLLGALVAVVADRPDLSWTISYCGSGPSTENAMVSIRSSFRNMSGSRTDISIPLTDSSGLPPQCDPAR